MVQTALFFEPELVPRLRGPAVGPKGPEIGQKPGAGFIILSSPRSAQGPRVQNELRVNAGIPKARVALWAAGPRTVGLPGTLWERCRL